MAKKYITGRSFATEEAMRQVHFMDSALDSGYCQAALLRLTDAAAANKGKRLTVDVGRRFARRCLRKNS